MVVFPARPSGVVFRLVDARYFSRRTFARDATHQTPRRNPTVIFEFIVRRLRWLARVPLAPQVLDALLLAGTALFHRDRFAALEALEVRARQLPGVRPCRHRFGGIGFARGGCEFAHLHGNGLLDVHLTRECAESMVAADLAQPHHVFGPSAWVSFWVRSKADLPNAVMLLSAGDKPRDGVADRAAPEVGQAATARRRDGSGGAQDIQPQV